MRLVVAKRTVGSFSTIPFLTPVAEERTAGFARDDGFIHFEKTHPLEALDSLKCLTEPRDEIFLHRVCPEPSRRDAKSALSFRAQGEIFLRFLPFVLDDYPMQRHLGVPFD